MIDFSCRCYHKDRTPIVKDLYIQDYAEALLADYRPELLKTPGKVDAFHFLENYLGVTVEFQDIFYPEGKVPVAGATIFNDEAIMVFDRSGMKVSSIDVPAGTVLIDNATMKSESFALFTALHEGGHYCMHQGVYKLDPDQVSLFESDGHVVKCMRTTIERRGPLVTQKDFREHQASTFAAAVAMPRPTFIPLMGQVIREAGFYEGIWVEDPLGDWEDQFKLDSCSSFPTEEELLVPSTLCAHFWLHRDLRASTRPFCFLCPSAAGGKETEMKITYAFADGTTSVVEVDDEIGAYIMDSRRQENNDDRRHRYHNYSLDDVTYEGSEYGRCDVYSFDNESEELAAHVRDAFSHLTDAQRRRLLMSSKGMSLREIAAAEGTSHLASLLVQT